MKPGEPTRQVVTPARDSDPSRSSGPMGQPDGTIVEPDGSIIVPLSRPVEVPGFAGRSRETSRFTQLKFRRLTGAACSKIQNSRHKIDVSFAQALDVSVPVAAFLRENVSLPDLEAMSSALLRLMPSTNDFPGRALEQPDGGFLLPLQYPVSDDDVPHGELRFKPLTSQRAQAVLTCRPEKAVPFGIHYAAGLSLRSAVRLADRMDGVDYRAAEAVLVELVKRATGARAMRK